MNAIAVTRIGVRSAVGDLRALMEALDTGRSGLSRDERMVALRLRCTMSGRVPDVDSTFANAQLGKAERRYFCRFSRLGYVAACDALEGERLPGRGGVIVGSGVGPIGELDTQLACVRNGQRPESAGHTVPRVMPSFLPAFLAQRLGACLGGATTSLACNSALVALHHACEAIGSGAADWYLVGGVEEDSAATWWSFDQMRALAREPALLLSPRAWGFVPAGAAAFVLLESTEHARARGADDRVRIASCIHLLGCTAGMNGFDAEGYRACIGQALDRAGLGPRDVDLVAPHANGSPSDVDEILALDQAMELERGAARLELPKALVGHSLGASGIVDLVALVAQLQRGSASADVLVGELHPRLAHLAGVLARPARGPARTALKTGHAFGGSSAAVVLRAVE